MVRTTSVAAMWFLMTWFAWEVLVSAAGFPREPGPILGLTASVGIVAALRITAPVAAGRAPDAISSALR